MKPPRWLAYSYFPFDPTATLRASETCAFYAGALAVKTEQGPPPHYGRAFGF